VRVRVELPDGLDQPCGQAGGRVHRQVKRHEIGLPDSVLAQALAREIQASDLISAGAQPGRGRGQSKRLVAKFIRRDKYNVHGAFGSSVSL
jgi:hypothetical protein